MNKIPMILCLSSWFLPYDDEQKKKVYEVAKDCEVHVIPAGEVPQDIWGRADVICGSPDAKTLKTAYSLKWLQIGSAGVEPYIAEGVYAHPGVILTNGSGIYGQPIAEHILAMILSFCRNLHIVRDNQPKALWARSSKIIRDFSASSLLVVGLGDIGSNLALRANALGASVSAIKRTVGINEKYDYIENLCTMEQLDSLLPNADFVVLCLPATKNTVGAMNKRRLSIMKKGSILVNIGRGSLVDQEALVDSLQSGHLGGAALDVTTPEPLPAGSPLWKMENVIITPHISGLSPTNSQRFFDIFINNLKRYLKGEPLEKQVDFNQEY